MKAKATNLNSPIHTAPEWANSRNLAIITGILTVLVYIPALSNGLVWDDVPYVSENPYLQVFSSKLFTANWMGNYHPLTLLSLFIDYSIAGIEPLFYHIHNIALHLITTLLTGLLLSRYTKSDITGWTAALIYGIHPIHVESVAWISERKDLLYGLFYFAGMLSWDEFRRTQNRKYQILTALLFILSCLGKGMAVTFPVVIVLMDYFYYRISVIKIVQDTLAGFAISIAFGIIAINAQKESSAMREGDYYTLIDHAAIGFTGWFLYLWKLIIPYPLSAVYTMPLKDPRTELFPNIFYICMGASLIIPIALWFGNNRLRLWILAFGGSVAHVLFAPVGSAMAADRYMYVPSFFFIWAVAEILTQGYKSERKIFSRNGWIFLLLTVPVLAWLTQDRTKVWKDNFTLFSDVAKQYPHDLLANNNIGLHYLKIKEYDKSREAYNRVIKHYPLDYTGYFNMGVSYNQEEKGREAMYYFLKVQELNPGYKDLPAQLGIAALFAKSNDTAVVALEKALALNADLPDNYFNLALAYSRTGRVTSSDSLYALGLRLDPSRTNTYLNLAYNARRRGDAQQEQAWIEKATKSGMELNSVLVNVGIMIGEEGDYMGSKAYFERALQQDTSDGEAWYNLGISYEKMDQLNTAIPAYVKAAQHKYQPAIDLLNKNGVGF